MAVVTVVAASVPIVGTTTSGSLTLRTWLSGANLITPEGVVIEHGDGGVTLPWYTDYECPVTNNVAAQPELTLYATTDRRNLNDQPQWNGVWLDNGQEVGTYFANYNVPPVTPTSIANLSDYQPPSALNQRWNYTAYNTDSSDSRYPQLVGLTPGYLPQVLTDSPARFEDSPFSGAGGQGQIHGDGGLIYGDDTTLNGVRIAPTAGATFGSYAEVLNGDLSAKALLKSGNAVIQYGRIGRIRLVTDLPFGLQNILVESQSALYGFADKIVLSNIGSGSAAAWAEIPLIGIDGGSEWYDDGIRMEDMGLSGPRNFFVLSPGVGAYMIRPNETLTMYWSSGPGTGARITAETFGWYIGMD